jgi:hypothetical protein
MIRALAIAAASAAVLMFSSAAFAQQTGGTANEAKAMLMKAVAAVKRTRPKRSICSTREKAGSWTGTSIRFAMRLMAHHLPQLRMVSCLTSARLPLSRRR